MDKQTAERIMNALLDAGSSVANTVDEIRGKLPEDQVKGYTKAVGEVLASIQLDLMAPIVRLFPELDRDQ